MKAFLRRRVTRHLERAVVELIKRNPQLKIVAVGGSVGKTSTKLAVAKVLAEKYRVLVHEGNYNSELGLPLSLFGLEVPAKTTSIEAWLHLLKSVKETLRQPYPYDVAVLELGIDHPGDMARFMAYLKPDIGLVTAIAPEHMEYFTDLSVVAEEEFTLDLGSKTVALHLNDKNLRERKDRLGDRRVVTYGESGDVHWADGNNLCLGELTEVIPVKPQVLGDHSRLVLLAAATVGVMLELSPDQIRKGLDKVTAVPGRMQVLKGKNGITIIDDSYNSSPEAVYAALATLSKTAKGRRIALLGQMNELGDYSLRAHTRVGQEAADLDLLLTLGKDANEILGPSAVEAGLAKSKWHRFDSPYEAGEWLAKEAKKGDTILFKGSQNGVFAEEAIKPLLADQADAAKLVRQSPSWLARKAKQFGVA
jgi:UDP-N-acetylmuramoyl-tripeptide--D-alanyl-D-alanine ligase